MINYSLLNKLNLKNTKNLALFCDENFNIINLSKLGFSNQKFISKLINNNKNNKKDIILTNLNEKLTNDEIRGNKRKIHEIFDDKS